ACVREALERGFTHLCFVDDDMVFPSDSIIRLASHRRAVVGINYTKKGIPPEGTGLALTAERLDASKGIEEVGRLGFGMLLIRLGAIDKIPPPQFPMQW